MVRLCICALKYDVAIPLEAESLQSLDDLVGGARLFARRVDIFDTKQPMAVIDTCLEIAGDSRNE